MLNRIASSVAKWKSGMDLFLSQSSSTIYLVAIQKGVTLVFLWNGRDFSILPVRRRAGVQQAMVE